MVLGFRSIAEARRHHICKFLAANPKASTRAAAIALTRSHPELFASYESARNCIRYYRNEKTNKKPAKPLPACLQRTKKERKDILNRGIPPAIPQRQPFRKFQLPDDGRWLIMSDIHLRHHDKAAVEAAIAEGVRRKCKNVLLNGDIVDCEPISRWPHEHSELLDEISLAAQFFDYLACHFSTIWWKFGNHENRLPYYLIAKAPELAVLPQVTIESIFNTANWGITTIPAHCPITHHALTILHGHECGRSVATPVNPARSMFLRTTECVLVGHFHRTSHHVEQTLSERPISCWSVGCLCDLHPLYAPLANRWNQGFAILDTGPDWHVTNLRLIDGKPC